MLSSHLLGDLERVCDHLVVLDRGRVRLAADVDDLLAAHHRLTGRATTSSMPANQELLNASHTERRRPLLVRTDGPITTRRRSRRRRRRDRVLRTSLRERRMVVDDEGTHGGSSRGKPCGEQGR